MNEYSRVGVRACVDGADWEWWGWNALYRAWAYPTPTPIPTVAPTATPTPTPVPKAEFGKHQWYGTSTDLYIRYETTGNYKLWEEHVDGEEHVRHDCDTPPLPGPFHLTHTDIVQSVHIALCSDPTVSDTMTIPRRPSQ